MCLIVNHFVMYLCLIVNHFVMYYSNPQVNYMVTVVIRLVIAVV